MFLKHVFKEKTHIKKKSNTILIVSTISHEKKILVMTRLYIKTIYN